MNADRWQSLLYAAANALAGSVLTLLAIDAQRYVLLAVALCAVCVACFAVASRVGRPLAEE
jgi:hypothetical protein